MGSSSVDLLLDFSSIDMRGDPLMVVVDLFFENDSLWPLLESNGFQ